MSRTVPMRAFLLLLALPLLSVGAQQHGSASPATSTGAYSAEQADRGRRIFGASCASCHGVELEGATGPALSGAAFLAKWNGGKDRTLADLFRVLRTTMPKPAIGSLSVRAYLDAFSYLLMRNGVPTGPRALVATGAALGALRLPAGVVAAQKVPPAFIPGEKGLIPSGTGPTQSDLSATSTGADWTYATGNYAGTRYSALAQITSANAGTLGVACVYQLGGSGTFASNPVVFQGTMYVTTTRETAAIDAASCRPIWKHTWEPRDNELWLANRGVAIKGGYVVRGTSDGYLLALDTRDGRQLWARHVARPDSGETFTMPAMIFEDLVLIGPAGSEAKLMGWIGAFRLSDGKPVWRFNTVPRKGEPGAETWGNSDRIPVGGGSVWTPLSLDPAKGELYVAVTNPAPDLPSHLRPGKNLYTNSIVALNVRTGKLNWYEQLVPNDARDWDLTQVSPLFRGSARGQERNLVVTSGKDGMVRLIDRDTHERLWETAVTTRLNTEGPLPKEGLRVCPGILGGVQWNGPALHPSANLLVVPSVDWCFKFTPAPDDSVKFVAGQNYLGGQATPDSASSGWLTALDATTGAIRWRYRSPKPMVAAVTTTAGGLVFTCETVGDFLAFDAESGKELYRFYTGAGLFGGVMTYEVSGRQYVAAASGGGSLTFGRSGAPTVFVFALPKGP